MRRIGFLMMALVVACACHAEDITIRYKGTTAKVDQKVKDSVNITVSGAFSVGGGMGEMPSVPTNATAKQPTVLLIGLNITKDEPITICDANGKRLDTITIPFSMRRSASLVTCPAFKLGNTYTVKTKGYEKTFTLNEPFTTVR